MHTHSPWTLEDFQREERAASLGPERLLNQGQGQGSQGQVNVNQTKDRTGQGHV